jgi:hypothetical protein
VDQLSPIVSPMVAMGRVIKRGLRPGAKVVFIGPCIARKKRSTIRRWRATWTPSDLCGAGSNVPGGGPDSGEAGGASPTVPCHGWDASFPFPGGCCAARP